MARPAMDRYPRIGDLEARARRRIPHFAWEYLDMGTSRDEARDRNIEALRRIQFVPQFFKGDLTPRLAGELFGVSYAAPFGVAPVGVPHLFWPGADAALAATANRRRIPLCLSTVGSAAPEAVGPACGGMGWFQLYPPRDAAVRADLIDRARSSGFTTLVLTADIPASSRRERQRRSGVRNPPRVHPRLAVQAAARPAWAVAALRRGLPRFRGLEAYVDHATMASTAGLIASMFGAEMTWDYLREVRGLWEGPLVVKGILDPGDAQRCVDLGADAVQVSNHGGRQLDGAVAAVDALPAVVARIGAQVPVLFDGGVRSGLDVARALALGATFVFCGRAFMFGLGALGDAGPDHVFRVLEDELTNVMKQAGCRDLGELSSRLAG